MLRRKNGKKKNKNKRKFKKWLKAYYRENKEVIKELEKIKGVKKRERNQFYYYKF